MPESPVQKHKGDKRENLVWGAKISTDLRNRITGWNKTINVNKTIQTGTKRELKYEN
jgi:hypothetical protein